MSPEERAKTIAAQSLNAGEWTRADVSLDAPLVTEDGDGEGSILDRQADNTPTPEERLANREELRVRREALRTTIEMLGPRERRIFMARRLTNPPVTHQALGTELSIGRENVRQIEGRALEAVKAEVARLMREPRSALARNQGSKAIIEEMLE